MSGDFIYYCLFLYLLVFVVQVYKRLEALGLDFSFLSFLSHHIFPTPINMSPAHSSFLFSFKEDACASDVVESMEQVGDLF